MKAFKKLTLVTVMSLSLLGLGSTVGADSQFEAPTDFESAQTIQEVAQEIEEFYGNGEVTISDVPRYSFRSVTSNGNMGHYVTHTGWVHGSQMVTWSKVGNAQRNAVIARMGYFDPNRSYFMKTTQNIINASKWQTQGYYTLSVTAYCFYPG